MCVPLGVFVCLSSFFIEGVTEIILSSDFDSKMYETQQNNYGVKAEYTGWSEAMRSQVETNHTLASFTH